MGRALCDDRNDRADRGEHEERRLLQNQRGERTAPAPPVLFQILVFALVSFVQVCVAWSLLIGKQSLQGPVIPQQQRERQWDDLRLGHQPEGETRERKNV